MKGFVIGPVRYVMFGPFRDVSYDFSKAGVNTIEGVIRKFGCESNGAGKSFLFDGIAWALYGRCLRPEYSGDDVIHLNAQDTGCKVDVTIYGDHTLRIVRHRKWGKNGNVVMLSVDGVDQTCGRNVDTTARIAETLGMDFQAFASSVAFGVREDLKSFFLADDTQRKATLDKLLGLELFSEARLCASKALQGVVVSLQTVDDQMRVERTRLEGHEENLRSIVSEEPGLDEIALKHLQSRKRRLDRAVSAAQTRVNAYKGVLLQAKGIHAQLQRTYQDELAAFRQEQRKAQSQRQATLSGITEAKTNLGSNAKQRERVTSVAGKRCPTCRHTMTAVDERKVLAELDEERLRLEQLLDRLELELAAFDRVAQAMVEPVPPNAESVAEAEEDVSEAGEELSALLLRQRAVSVSLDHELRRTTERETRQREIQARTDAVNRRLTELTTQSAGLTQESADVSFWVEGFSNRGVKSFLIEAELGEINRLATQFAQELLGPGAVVRLTATKQLKSRDGQVEKLAVEGSIPGLTRCYSGASKGQKRRMDLALLLAFRSLAASRLDRPFNQLFVDELFDGLDRAGVEQVAQLLKRIGEECPVTLVTHDANLKYVGDSVTTVFHDGDHAVIMSSSGEQSVRRLKSKGKA